MRRSASSLRAQAALAIRMLLGTLGLEVRDGLTSDDDPGRYKHPPEMLARKVTPR
jgi:hypothetical protein